MGFYMLYTRWKENASDNFAANGILYAGADPGGVMGVKRPPLQESY